MDPTDFSRLAEAIQNLSDSLLTVVDIERYGEGVMNETLEDKDNTVPSFNASRCVVFSDLSICTKYPHP